MPDLPKPCKEVSIPIIPELSTLVSVETESADPIFALLLSQLMTTKTVAINSKIGFVFFICKVFRFNAIRFVCLWKNNVMHRHATYNFYAPPQAISSDFAETI